VAEAVHDFAPRDMIKAKNRLPKKCFYIRGFARSTTIVQLTFHRTP
jgi:hypothetical protein